MANKLLSTLFFLLSIVSFLCWQRERLERQKLEGELTNIARDSRHSIKSYGTDIHGVAIPRIEPSPTISSSAIIPEASTLAPSPTIIPARSEDSVELSEIARYGIESRISSIEKMVSVSEDQKARLREKFTNDARARKRGEQVQSESLASIIGEANANFYQEQVRNAFQKAQDQELDRDIFYLSRRLSFTPEQEAAVRKIITNTEAQTEAQFTAERASPSFQSDAGFRVRLMIKENEFKSQRLSEQLKGVLSQDQYQAYLQEEAESSNADVGMLHAP